MKKKSAKHISENAAFSRGSLVISLKKIENQIV